MTDENQTPEPKDEFVLGVDPESPDKRPLIEAQDIHDKVTRLHTLVQVARLTTGMLDLGDEPSEVEQVETEAYYAGLLDAFELVHEVTHGGDVSNFLHDKAVETGVANGMTEEEVEAQAEAIDLVMGSMVEQAKAQRAMKDDIESAFLGDEDFESLAKQFEQGDTSDEEDGN
jgi:hypothetical protein